MKLRSELLPLDRERTSATVPLSGRSYAAVGRGRPREPPLRTSIRQVAKLESRQTPSDPRSELAVTDQAGQRLAAGLRLPTGLHPALAAAVAVQVGAAGYGIAAQTAAGLVVALAGVAVLMGVAALLLHQFRRINGVRVGGLSSRIVLGTGGTSTLVYLIGFGAATWAAFESRWWLVATAAVVAGVGYAFGTLRWWHAYRHDPATHAGGAPPWVLATLAAVACLGLVALLIAG